MQQQRRLLLAHDLAGPHSSACPKPRPCHHAVQATEAALWNLFSPIGEVLELYILRGPNGLSRGCGFVTYANKFLAQQAIMQLNGKQVSGKVLVVKLADRSMPSKSAPLPGSL